MKASFIVLCALLFAAGLAKADDDFSAVYAAAAPGDDPAVTGTLDLEIEDDDDTISYRATLSSVYEITGVHLHLQGNSSEGLYGGPLVLALTNTTVANGEAPVSSTGTAPLVQTGTKTAADLAANPQAAAVQARMTELGLNGAPPTRPAELAALIKIGVIYTDVHSTERVSPEGVTRGLVTDDDNDDDDIDTNAAAGTGATATGDDDGGSSDDGSTGSTPPTPDDDSAENDSESSD